MASTRALFAVTDSPFVSSRICFKTKGVFSLPMDPDSCASRSARVMIVAIIFLAMEYSAGIGFAKRRPEVRGNSCCASKTPSTQSCTFNYTQTRETKGGGVLLTRHSRSFVLILNGQRTSAAAIPCPECRKINLSVTTICKSGYTDPLSFEIFQRSRYI